MRKRRLLATLFMPLLPSCSMLHSDDPAALAFEIPEGSRLAVTRALPIGNNITHATIQFGKLIRDNDRQDYDVNCRIDYRAFGPREVSPESYGIRRTEDGNVWISQPSILRFYTEVYLDSEKGTDVIKMVCQQYGDQNDNHFTVADMQATLGGIARFVYPATSPAAKTGPTTAE